MKAASGNASWLGRRREERFAKLKLWQRRRIASETSVQRLPSAALDSRQQPAAPFAEAMTAVKQFLRRGQREDYEHVGSFQEAIRPVLVLAQIFALMPVAGVTAQSAQDLSFEWRHVRTLYALLVIVGFAVCSAFTIAFAFRSTFNYDSVEAIVFYTSIFWIAIAFFVLARKWPALMVQWQQVERSLPALRTEAQRAALARRIKIIALVATVCSLAEHLLSMLSLIYFVNGCPALPNRPIESFLYSSFNMFFYFVAYNTPAGIIGKVLNVLSTFAWNFNDIFVMSVSVALSARFRQLNDHMQSAVHLPTKEQFWIKCRVSYRNLCKLCAAVDDDISTITLLCFANNLYFICGKILKSLSKKPSVAHTLYFWYSLIFLLARTFVLSVFVAEINDESKRPLRVFRRVAREFWCPELRRFSEEVTTDVVALSGMKFFQITRSVVLSVAGTIVTYELVLLQYNKQDHVSDCYES